MKVVNRAASQAGNQGSRTYGTIPLPSGMRAESLSTILPGTSREPGNAGQMTQFGPDFSRLDREVVGVAIPLDRATGSPVSVQASVAVIRRGMATTSMRWIGRLRRRKSSGRRAIEGGGDVR